MERLPNLGAIDTNRIEGRLLIAAISQIESKVVTLAPHTKDEILHQIHNQAEVMYAGVPDVPKPEPAGTFEQELSKLINRFGQEHVSETPDFILAEYMLHSLLSFNRALSQRKEWYSGAEKAPVQ